MSSTLNFDWGKFLIGLISALMGALTASAAANALPQLEAMI